MVVSMKDLIAKILSALKMTSFSMTVNVSNVVFTQHCTYNSATRTVRITATVWATSGTWSQSQTILTIPQAYRPKANTYAPAILTSSSSTIVGAYRVIIATDGTIKQDYTAACKCLFFTVEYQI